MVYVAPGSHATYLTVGPHGILDFEDIATDLLGDVPTGFLARFPPLDLLVPAILFVGLWEHLVDSEDETSDDGVSVGPGLPDEPNLKFDKRIEVTPLSDFEGGRNIYQGQHRALLAVGATRANGAAMTASSTRAGRGRTRPTVFSAVP